jgi:hypothetical protein
MVGKLSWPVLRSLAGRESRMARGRRGTRGNAEEGWIERLSISGYVIYTRISPQYSHHVCLCLVYKVWGPTCNQPVGAPISHYYCRRTAARTLQDSRYDSMQTHAPLAAKLIAGKGPPRAPQTGRVGCPIKPRGMRPSRLTTP